jgi:hypothetical protein
MSKLDDNYDYLMGIGEISQGNEEWYVCSINWSDRGVEEGKPLDEHNLYRRPKEFKKGDRVLVQDVHNGFISWFEQEFFCEDEGYYWVYDEGDKTTLRRYPECKPIEPKMSDEEIEQTIKKVREIVKDNTAIIEKLREVIG